MNASLSILVMTLKIPCIVYFSIIPETIYQRQSCCPALIYTLLPSQKSGLLFPTSVHEHGDTNSQTVQSIPFAIGLNADFTPSF